ncbi:LptA/OstA family protein [Roseospirillum parvum]|uniref:Lipopolysaccharide export system protein LptA n=1 Tax=Roseospirillum parvum TaxID=83401 RepID=A0A1G8B9N2_9PROT|nr:LptA/OstA family protein [Roseospirillum parvum]SDH29310.1 lipopolysaccharide export system protein LptA [Roseospirillum parvum]
MPPVAVRLTGLLAVLLLATPLPLAAQGLDFARRGDSPVEVLADDGIEWQRDRNRFIARGNAVANRGTVSVRADLLIAHYAEEGGGTDIQRLDAEGNVTIASPTETATGASATYDVPAATLVLNGDPVRLTTPDQVITAHQSMEYYERKRLAVARGRAHAVRNGRTITADVLTAHFVETAGGSSEISRFEAFGNVVIDNGAETVRGNKGRYEAKTGIATLEGSVKIVRQDDQVAGELAVVDLNTGVSTLYGSPQGAGGQGRVRAVISPRGQDSETPTDGQ